VSRSAIRGMWLRWFAVLVSALLAALGAWPTPGLLWESEAGKPGSPLTNRCRG
jgi:hypothetical protein